MLTDEALQNGPLKDRKCTDVLFFILFLAAFVAYGYTLNYGWNHNQKERFFAPVDGEGKLCGVDDVNKDYPLLYYAVLKAEPTAPRALCVKECPLEINDPVDCRKTDRIASQAVCASTSDRIGYGTNRVLNRFCMPDVDKLPPNFENSLNNLVGSFGLDDIQEQLEDIDDAYWLYVYSFVTCVLIAVGYAVLIYQFTGFIVWVSILATGFGLVVLSLWLQKYKNDKYGPGSKWA